MFLLVLIRRHVDPISVKFKVRVCSYRNMIIFTSYRSLNKLSSRE